MFDYGFEVNDAGLIAACTATIVALKDIVTIGNGLLVGNLVIELSAIEIADDDELFTLALQGSDSPTFASNVECLAICELGAKEVLNYSDVDSTVGKYVIPFRNERCGITYPYIRLICDVAGTVTTGINFTARIEAL